MPLLTLSGEHKDRSPSALWRAMGGMLNWLLGLLFWIVLVLKHFRAAAPLALPAIAAAAAVYLWYYNRVYVPRLLAFRDEHGEAAATRRARKFALWSTLPWLLAAVLMAAYS